MSVVPPLSEDDEMLAAELAFGLLDPPELAIAERRLASDPGFVAAHRRWQDRAAGLFVDADIAPPAGVWDAILTRLPANDPAPDPSLLVRLRRWQGASAIAAMLAIVSTATLLLRVPPTPIAATSVAASAPRPLIAVLASPDRPAAVAIGYDPASRRLTVLPSRLAPGARATELWVIPAGGIPHTVGVVAADGPETRAVPSAVAALITPGATLAISLEPAGGSPTGKPTGPVIVTGSVAVT